MDKLYMYFRGICKKMTCQHFFPVFCKHTSDKRCKIDRGLTCHVVSYKRVLYIIVKASCFAIRISIAKKNSSEQLLKKSEAIWYPWFSEKWGYTLVVFSEKSMALEWFRNTSRPIPEFLSEFRMKEQLTLPNTHRKNCIAPDILGNKNRTS